MDKHPLLHIPIHEDPNLPPNTIRLESPDGPQALFCGMAVPMTTGHELWANTTTYVPTSSPHITWNVDAPPTTSVSIETTSLPTPSVLIYHVRRTRHRAIFALELIQADEVLPLVDKEGKPSEPAYYQARVLGIPIALYRSDELLFIEQREGTQEIIAEINAVLQHKEHKELVQAVGEALANDMRKSTGKREHE